MVQSEPRCLLMIRLPRQAEIALEDRFLPQPAASRPVMGYHISLVGPFFWQSPLSEPCMMALQQVCARQAPLAISLAGLGVFDDDPADQAVFVGVQDPAPLRALRNGLLDVIRDQVILQRQEEPDSYRPHVTLALHLSDREAQGLLSTNDAAPCKASFEATEVFFVRQEPNSPWSPVLALTLGRDVPPRMLEAEREDG